MGAPSKHRRLRCESQISVQNNQNTLRILVNIGVVVSKQLTDVDVLLFD